MPFFRKRTAPSVEAYQLPQPGQEPSDGLVFFLEANGLSPAALSGYPGDWVVVDKKGGVCVYRPEDFDLLYERV